MKKILFIAAALAASAACTKTTTVYDDSKNEIGLSPVTGQITKANGPIKDNTYTTDQSFGVFAYHKITESSEAWATFYGTAAPSTYINNGKFSYEDSNWGGSPNPYYWPKTGYLAFAGYSPYKEENSALYTGDIYYLNELTPSLEIKEFKQGSYNWNSGADIVTNETVDLMWFDADDQNTVNAGPVSVKFRHALAWLDFKLKTDETAADKFKILKITLKNVYTKGDFKSNSGAENNTDEWTNHNEATDIVLYDNTTTGTTINTTAVTYGNLLVIPQSVEAVATGTTKDASQIVIEYQQLTTDGTPLTETYTGALSGTWDLGKHYIYNIKFTLNEILISPSVDSWIDGTTDGDITIE